MPKAASGQRALAGWEGMYPWELFLRQDNSCFGEGIPIQALPAAVAVMLVFPFEGFLALRTDWETGKAVGGVKAADLSHRHWLAEGHFPPDRRRDQQVIGRQIKTEAEVFQGQDRWGGFTPCDVTVSIGVCWRNSTQLSSP